MEGSEGLPEGSAGQPEGFESCLRGLKACQSSLPERPKGLPEEPEGLGEEPDGLPGGGDKWMYRWTDIPTDKCMDGWTGVCTEFLPILQDCLGHCPKRVSVGGEEKQRGERECMISKFCMT